MCRWHLLLVVMGSCGGRTVLEDTIPGAPPTQDGGAIKSDAEKEDNWTTVGPGCAIVLDVRMCTPQCRQFDCCESLYDANGSPAGVGICWIDRPKEQTCNRSCEACVHKTPDLDVCVPPYLCTGLQSLSGKDPCFKPK